MTQTIGSLRAMSLRHEVATDFPALDSLREQWDALALKLEAPVCMTFDWLRTWWEHYGGRNQLRIFLFWQGERLVSVLPLYLESFGIGPLKTVVARIVGANIPPRRFDPPVDAGFADEVFARVYRRLFVIDGCHLFSFGPVSDDWQATAGLDAALRADERPIAAVSRGPADVHTAFSLSGEFARKLTSRKTAKHYLRELEKLDGLATDVVVDPRGLEESFDAFARQHAEQWRIVGKGGHFVAWPGAEEFHRTLVRRQGQLGRTRFYRILVHGEMIACCYAYIFGTDLSWELPSRVTGPEWDKLGLGKAVFLKMCQSGVASGLLSADAGLGRYSYKANLGGAELPVRTLRIVARRPSSRARTAAFLAAVSILRILYHKIWYRRIMPRLPEWTGRSQWKFWLRLQA